MPSRATLDWRGKEFIAEVRTAARLAVSDTVDAARDDALATHEWVNRTGQLEEELISEHAKPRARNPLGRFGTTRRRGFYGLFHEEGTVHEYARPFLRPAAARQFPGLAQRIRLRLLLTRMGGRS